MTDESRSTNDDTYFASHVHSLFAKIERFLRFSKLAAITRWLIDGYDETCDGKANHCFAGMRLALGDTGFPQKGAKARCWFHYPLPGPCPPGEGLGEGL